MENDEDWKPPALYLKSAKECRQKLSKYYVEVLNDVTKARSNLSKPNTSPAKTEKKSETNRKTVKHSVQIEFLKEWNADHRQEFYLPIALQLLEKAIKGEEESEEKNGATLYYGRDKSKDKSPRALLLMAGYSVEQLALSITLHYKQSTLDAIVPFIGISAWNDVKQSLKTFLQHALGLKEGNRAFSLLPLEAEYVNTSDPANVFKKVREWAQRNREHQIAVDVTGGQKPMDAGGTYAAMFLGVPAYYLDFTEYDESNRRPYPHSLRYKQLALPNAVFSHDARKEVVAYFHTRRFNLAYQRLVELQKDMQSAGLSDYFEDSERIAVVRAVGLLDRCNALMSADYRRESLAGTLLHKHFSALGNKDIRECVARLQEKPELVLAYVTDEFWRLRTMLESAWLPVADELAIDNSLALELSYERLMKRADNNPAQPTENEIIRDVVVGSLALAEFIVDSVFWLPEFHPVIQKIESVKVSNIGRYSFDQNEKERVTDLIRNQLSGQALFPRRMPKGVQDGKISLLLEGSCKFDVWISENESIASANDKRDFVIEGFMKAFNSEKEVSTKEGRLILSAKLTFGRPLLSNSDAEPDFWETKWGAFGDSKGAWSEARHVFAHMRAPVDSSIRKIAANAVFKYLPRFIGMYSILSAESPTLPISDDAAWVSGKSKVEQPMVPWFDGPSDSSPARDKEYELRECLSLPQA